MFEGELTKKYLKFCDDLSKIDEAVNNDHEINYEMFRDLSKDDMPDFINANDYFNGMP